MSTTAPTSGTHKPVSTHTPTDLILNASLIVAPLVYLAADSTYAARGWDDATAGVLHVIGAIGYGFVVVCVAGWLPRQSRLAAAILVAGLIGLAGNTAYGFDTIHASLGDTPLVDQPGAANLIKPLGLFVPLSLALIAWALGRLGPRGPAVLILIAALAWPVGHIANIGSVAVAVNIALVTALGSLRWSNTPPTS